MTFHLVEIANLYDLLLVGAGITSASIVAELNNTLRILVVDQRSHLGGNCYDYRSDGTYIHQYGPHIFHSKDQGVVDFLSRYTQWIEKRHWVQAITDSGQVVPFPYSKETEAILGKLSPEQIIATFFRGYSEKMWGMSWEQLPNAVKKRVPQNIDPPETSDYFPNQFTAYPKNGYSEMIGEMFNGKCEMKLGIGPDEWLTLSKQARKTVFMGRPDSIKLPGETNQRYKDITGDLSHRSLKIEHRSHKWDYKASSVNFCSLSKPHTRQTCYRLMNGGSSDICSFETPCDGTADVTPYYPFPTEENNQRYQSIKKLVLGDYPNLVLGGRMGTYQYLDMYQAVAQGRVIANKVR